MAVCANGRRLTGSGQLHVVCRRGSQQLGQNTIRREIAGETAERLQADLFPQVLGLKEGAKEATCNCVSMVASSISSGDSSLDATSSHSLARKHSFPSVHANYRNTNWGPFSPKTRVGHTCTLHRRSHHAPSGD